MSKVSGFKLIVFALLIVIAIGLFISTFVLRNLQQPERIFTLDNYADFVDYSFNGEQFITVDHSSPNNSSIQIWSSSTYDLIHSFELNGTIRLASLSPENNFFVTEEGDNVIVRDTSTGRESFVIASAAVPSFRWAGYSPDGNYILTIGTEATQLWNAQNGQLIHQLVTLSSNSKAAFSNDSRLVALTSSASGGIGTSVVKIFDVETGAELQTLIQDVGIEGLAWSPDNQNLVTSGHRGEINVWNVIEGEMLIQIANDTQQTVLTIDYSLCGKFLVSGGAYPRLTIWDTTSWNSITQFGGQEMYINATFNPNGLNLSAHRVDRGNTYIEIWQLPSWLQDCNI